MTIVGVVDRIAADAISGWAFRVESPDEHLSVTVRLADIPIGVAEASNYRPDGIAVSACAIA
jgi:hypothetical protein